MQFQVTIVNCMQIPYTDSDWRASWRQSWNKINKENGINAREVYFPDSLHVIPFPYLLQEKGESVAG